MTRVALPAPAKINLGLQVTGRREDGYHSLVTILQTLELADSVVIDENAAIDGTPSHEGLARQADLTIQAAERLHSRVRPSHGAYLRVEKRIPVAAGLGGGSSDAAAAILGLDALWQTDTEFETLVEVAASLGADVPFFLYRGTVLATGRGDAIERLPAPPQRWVVLAKIDRGLRTADVYSELRESEWTDGAATHELAGGVRDGALPPNLLQNDLTPAAMRLAPEIGDVLEALRMEGAAPAQLAGAGPTCFGLFESEAAARAAEARLSGVVAWVATTQFWNRTTGQSGAALEF